MTYTTVQGDMWDGIAHKLFGSSEKTNELIKVNSAHADEYVFSAGVELTVPDLDTDTRPNSLPPWKQVKG